MAHIEWIGEGQNKRAKICYSKKSIHGRKRFSKTFPAGTPRKVIKEFMNRVELENLQSDYGDYSKRTIDMFLKDYFEFYAPNQLSASTQKKYYSIAYADKPYSIHNYFGSCEIRKLRTRDIQEYIQVLIDNKLSKKSIQNQVGFLSTIFRKCVRLGYADTNIVAMVELPKMQNKRQVESYNEEELKLLLDLAREDNNELLTLQVFLGVFCGLRRSELMGLEFSDIQKDTKTIAICRSRVAGIGGDFASCTKTEGSIREIPINEEVYKLLKKRQRHYNEDKLRMGSDKFVDSNAVFSNKDGSVQNGNSINIRWGKFMKKHEDKIRYLNFHAATRHSFASILVTSGTDIRTCMELMGHKDLKTTLLIYSNSNMQKKRENIDKISDILLKQEA